MSTTDGAHLFRIGVLTICLFGFGGCNTVTFDHRPPDTNLDFSQYFVGTITTNQTTSKGFENSSAFFFSKPDKSGRREFFFTEKSNDPEAEASQPMQGGSYLYKLGGQRFHFFEFGDVAAGRYTVVRVGFESGKLVFEIPNARQMNEVWPLANKEFANGNFHSSASPNELVAVFSDQVLVDELFVDADKRIIDLKSKTVAATLGEKQLTVSDPGGVTVSMLLPGMPTRSTLMTLFCSVFGIAALSMAFLTGRLLLQDKQASPLAFQQIVVSKKVLVAGAMLGTITGFCILLLHTAFSQSMRSWSIETLVPKIFVILIVSTLITWVVDSYGGILWAAVSEREEMISNASNALTERQIMKGGMLCGFVVAVTVLLTYSASIGSLFFWGPKLILFLVAFGISGGALGTWLTLRNEPSVTLVQNACRAKNISRAMGPVVLAMAMMAPGFLLTHWLQQKAMSLVDAGLSHQIDLDIPGIKGVVPVAREPTLQDGFIVFFLGVPQIEFVEWTTDVKEFSMKTPSPWREAVLSFLAFLTTLTTAILILLLARLFASIFLRVAATDEDEPIIYRPIA
ncbi:hypothetical protein [Rhodopirellula bahusiensis]|uniref:Uncharacterized protein n=1 Tax=Rhodopirellula bahusiensis TaxID=2014065 RepID=A0A2G1VXH9_9BACT|nr:hypothetical protein [Rhodopirellula bahusiensis]PHQ31486.1 hypothetical protein CEE69_30770 [Rhodopirellula bahusiensis]